jgi:2,4-dienoyl-CoA reductase-like NADH-dependent reductase (Old Yellow Enzyme family)
MSTAGGSVGSDAAAAPDPFSPGRLGPLTLRNRFIKSATYEGLSREGLVTDELIEFHRRPAAGGVGLSTVAYCAVAPEGRTSRHQLLWTEDALPGMRRLTDAVHAEGAAVSAQIGHAGPVAAPKGNGRPAIGPSRRFNKQALNVVREASPDDLRRVVDAHAHAAKMAIEAGFDAVEIHLGHNYLASAFLSPRLNRRDDAYGGSLENRARLARDIARAVRDTVGDRIAILAKLNMDDGVPGGFWLDEAMQVARWLDQDGSLDALMPTAGSSLLNPMYLFRGDAPLEAFAEVMPQPIRTGVRLVGSRFLKAYPYEDAYLLEDARQLRDAVSMPMILVGGVNGEAVARRAMAHGFGFVAMARALLREPDLVQRMQRERGARSLCNHNNRCMPTNFIGTHCVLVPPEDRIQPAHR